VEFNLGETVDPHCTTDHYDVWKCEKDVCKQHILWIPGQETELVFLIIEYLVNTNDLRYFENLFNKNYMAYRN
jgi:hypothetical protein